MSTAEETIAFFGDVHVYNHRLAGGAPIQGLNRRAVEGLQVFDAACCKGREYVVLGDLVDGPRAPPALLAAIKRIVERHKSLSMAFGGDGNETIINGNHDVFECGADDVLRGVRVGNSALASLPGVVLEPTAKVVSGVGLLCVPFRTGPATGWWRDDVLKAAMQLPDRPARIAIVTHIGISDDQTPPWLRGAPDSLDYRVVGSVAEEVGATLVVAGNWHTPKTHVHNGNVVIVQPGTLCPAGWDDAGLERGYVLILDTKTGAMKLERVPGPRFLNMTVEEALAATPDQFAQAAQMGATRLFIRVRGVDRDGLAGQLEHNLGTAGGAMIACLDLALEPPGLAAVDAPATGSSLGEQVSTYCARYGEDAPAVTQRIVRHLDIRSQL